MATIAFLLDNIDGRIIITGVNLSKKNEIPVGSEIIEVNGMPAEQFRLEKTAPYISSSTDYFLKDLSTWRLFAGLEGETFKVKLRKPDKTVVELNLTPKQTIEKEIYPPIEEKPLLEFKMMDKVAYVSLNSFQDAKIDTLFKEKIAELYKAKGLIIDLRNNGGGSAGIAAKIFKYLSTDTLLVGATSKTRIHRSAYKAWGKFYSVADTIQDEKAKESYLNYHDLSYQDINYGKYSSDKSLKKIIIPTVILIGHNTGSAAEDFLIYLDNQNHIIKIGERTTGSTGQPFLFDLPGGGSARVCTIKTTYPDGREFIGYGIKPDIEVIPTLSDYLDKKDPALDKAVEYLKMKIKY